MNYCVNCGHELGVGRYCTNCGHPVDSPTDTAERPRIAPVDAPTPPSTPPSTPPPAPPPAWTPPPPVRYPLFADDDARDTARDSVGEPAAASRHRGSRPWGLWAALGVGLVLVLVLAVALLTGGDDPPTPSAEEPDTNAPSSAGEEPSPTPAATQGSVTADASVTVPATAAAGEDVAGKRITYDAENMLDGVPETAWRMPGDGSGEEVAITLAEETTLRSVGLINGYAKNEGGRDWYHGNRRIEQVEWVFDDGTTVPQTLGDSTGVQSVDVDVTTTTITLRLVAVSAPGQGPDSRDFTAISDLLLVAGT